MAALVSLKTDQFLSLQCTHVPLPIAPGTPPIREILNKQLDNFLIPIKEQHQQY